MIQGYISSSGRVAFFSQTNPPASTDASTPAPASTLINIFTGSVSKLSDSTLTAALQVFNASTGDQNSGGGAYAEAASASGTQNSASNIIGTVTDPNGSRALSLGFNATMTNTSASLAILAGTYGEYEQTGSTSLTIASNGSITGTDSNSCTYTGTASVPNAAVNVYELDNMKISCPTTSAGVSLGAGAIAGAGLLSVIKNGTAAAAIVLIFSDSTGQSKLLELTPTSTPAAGSSLIPGLPIL